MGKHKHSKANRFFNISREIEIHAFSKVWDEWIP